MTIANDLKVILVHDRFAPNFAGGGEYVVLMIAKTLQQLGCQVKVICAGDPAITEFEGIKTERLTCSSYGFNLRWRQVAKYATGADIIHSFTYHGLYPAYKAAKALNVPLVNTVLALFGDAWLNMKPWPLGGIFRRYERFLLNLPVAARLYLSDFSLDLSRQQGLSQTGNRIIEPGISLDEYWAESKKRGVLFTGKFEGRKGVQQLLQVASDLHEIPFTLLGWGSNAIFRKVSVPANVEIVQFENRAQLASQMAKAQVFVFPTQVETFGLAVAEAMASACAIVSSSELPFAGIKVDRNDTEAMATAIAQLYRDPELCAQFGNENQVLVQRYNWQQHGQALLQTYRQILT